MSEFEQMFLNTMEFYETRSIPVFLHGSTLLRILRNGTVQPRADVIHDKEINIGILAEDFTDEVYKELQKEHPYFDPINGRLPNALIYYGKYSTSPAHPSPWFLEPGFVLLARFWQGKTKRIEYMGQDFCLEFPKAFFEGTLATVEVLGRQWSAPADPEGYLSYYFGTDWKEEKKEWHWGQATAAVDWKDLEIGGEL